MIVTKISRKNKYKIRVLNERLKTLNYELTKDLQIHKYLEKNIGYLKMTIQDLHEEIINLSHAKEPT